MPEINNYSFSHQELAAILVRQTNLHEGKWFVALQMSLTGGIMGIDPKYPHPSALIQVTHVGLQRADANTPPSLVVDAAVTNPPPKSSAKKR